MYVAQEYRSHAKLIIYTHLLQDCVSTMDLSQYVFLLQPSYRRRSHVSYGIPHDCGKPLLEVHQEPI